jgi:hypothetical protein
MIQHPERTSFKSEALSNEALRSEAPSVFAAQPMTGLSERYTFVPTTEIVAGLRDKGWLPVAAEQQRVRSPGRVGFQKHLIRFRRAEQMQTLDEWNAELVPTNSHDAACAYVMRVGVYRRICSNGLVVSDSNFEAIRFRHSGLKVEEIAQASYRILEYVPKVASLIDRFRKHRLDAPKSTEFARKALLLRYPTVDEAPIGPERLLAPRRAGDEATDLWSRFNCVQENLVRGGLSDNRRTRSGRLRRMRQLRGLDSKVDLNRQLWNLAELTAAQQN